MSITFSLADLRTDINPPWRASGKSLKRHLEYNSCTKRGILCANNFACFYSLT